MSSNTVTSNAADTIETFVEHTEIADRSTLERWATCPWQAKAVAEDRVVNGSSLAAAGQESHELYSVAIHEWIQSNGTMSAQDLANGIRQLAQHSRPDVQPIVVSSTKYSAWAWSNWLTMIQPDSILKFDGGPGDKCGQLAWDLEGATLTAEVDLLCAGPSPEILELYDWKTGWKEWSATDVRDSFQFQFYSWLVLQNYDVREVHVRVFNSRAGSWTGYVSVDREQLQTIRGRLLAALETQRAYRDQDDPPTWPDPDKCRICPAASICPCSGAEAVSLSSDPGKYIAEIYKLETRLKGMKKAAAAHADVYGTIQGPGGLRFGRDKPTSRKPTASLYSAREDEG